MPLKATLRPNRSDRDLQRRSTLDPAGLFKRTANKSVEFLVPSRTATSTDGDRPGSSDVERASSSVENQNGPPSPPIQEHNPMTRRFSVLRFRHASDSQLSTRAKEQASAEEAPPVPTIPNAPAIITTAPTVVEEAGDAPKKKGRFQQLASRRRSFDPNSTDRPVIRKSMDKKAGSDGKRGHFGILKKSNRDGEEPGRLSVSQRPPAVTESSGEGSSLSLPVPRMSDSSRSDASSGDGHVTFATNTPRRPDPKSNPSRFPFGRRNKQRQSLFPLPMKIPPPEFPDTAPATPRASTSGFSTGSPNHSPSRESPPFHAIDRNAYHDQGNGTRTPPMPSSANVAHTAAAMNLMASEPGLMRNDSQKSVQSSRSSPNAGAPKRLGLRGRSSTMNSLGGRSDDAPPPTPPYAASGRNSTSTAGRSSLSNLFGMGHRFRQNSEPYSPRHGSPAHGFNGLSSRANSMNASREALVLPEREEGETPGHYLERLEETMDRGVIASVLTKKDDPFSLAVLRSFMRKFAFFGDPTDMAIRKLLMQVELPREAQQIDRVLQGFADRYHECNPGIYINTDKAYFISFSILMLHTDVFNKNNKRKMQRIEYIKNSSCEGVSDDVLACFYDNIAYTPFIKVEDELDIKEIASRRNKKSHFKTPKNDPAKLATKEPIDPYTLIFEGKLDVLRPTIKDVMNLDDPYDYLGTAPSLDTRGINNSFSRFGVIQIVSSRSRPEAYMTESDNPEHTSVGIVEMPVTKVGLLWRKDPRRKAARSPWQEWGAVLTRSGLSFFRNSGWAKNLVHQHDQHEKNGHTGPVVFQPPLQDFKQDHIIPLDGAVALVDNTYRKHKNAFVVFSKAGEETFLADSEKDLNDWLGKLNYSAAFETLGVRPRGLIGGLYEGQRNRGIRRLESSHSTKSIPTATGEVTVQSGKIDSHFAQQMMNARKEMMQQRIAESEERLAQSIREMENRLRDARHLQILAPIQPKTRELVILAAGRLAAKLKWSRIEIWRMKCHRDILAQELEEEKNMATERQARIDKIAGVTAPSQPMKSPVSQATSKTSRIGGLARLSSRTSTSTSGQKAPHSPSLSVRPGTKSSRDTDQGDDIFKTPPENSRQSSPSQPSGHWELPPINFSPVSSNHRLSVASGSNQSPRLTPREHRPSVSTIGDHTVSSDAVSDAGSRYSTPPPGAEAHHDDEPRTPGPPAVDGARPETASESETDQAPAPLTGSPESRSRVRRSLHRTLRDSSHGGHRRSYKGKDSASTITSEDAAEVEGLSRAKGSFTVHGKKASVITFSPDWQDAEERLKVRKRAQSIVPDSAVSADSGADDKAHSIASESTATLQTPGVDRDATPRHLTVEEKRDRHVSSATIVPKRSIGSMDKQASEDHDDPRLRVDGHVEDQLTPSKRPEAPRSPEIESESGAEVSKLESPKSQAVEA